MPDTTESPDDNEAADAPPALTREDLDPGPLVGGWPREKLGPLMLGGVALIMAGFIVGRVTADDDADSSAVTTTVPELRFPAGDQDRSGYWGFGGVTPVLLDTFDRADDPTELGTADTGESWTVDSGTWGIDGSRAVAEASPRPGYAVIDGGAADRLTEATLMVVEPGAGIVFRYEDRRNHWEMTAEPGRGVWVITLVEDGEATVMAEAPGPVGDGTTVTVAQRGAELQVLIEGEESVRVNDPALQGQARSGLVSPADGSGEARWDRFYIGNMPEG